jgi:predicted AAA+ superfamily ATPase
LDVKAWLQEVPAVVLLGPRQIGKTTLAREVADHWPAGAVYLDLERPQDLRRLSDADAFLRMQAPRLTVLDEVQRTPELFEVLRSVIDENRRAGFRNGQFLLLGSASLDVTGRASESLTGRIAQLDLGGINVDEAERSEIQLPQVWLRGGYPDSLLARSDGASLRWREQLIRSYLERDVPMFAPRIPATTLRRLWTMLAHNSGGLLNAAGLASNLGISGPTVDRYIDLLADLGLVRRLQPWFANVGKRVVRSPKVYVRDTGLLHALLELETQDQLLGHPSVGASFESLAVESLCDATQLMPYFYRTSGGAEIDLVLAKGGIPTTAIEIKRSAASRPSPGFFTACEDLGISERYIVHADRRIDPYPHRSATVIALPRLVAELRPA